MAETMHVRVERKLNVELVAMLSVVYVTYEIILFWK